MLKKFSSKIKAFAFATVLASSLFTVPAVSAAEKEENSDRLVTPYSDLWKGNISVKVGEPVKWYVDVPEDVTPKGCGATIKIPGLGWGTDTHNKEEGHLTLKQGENFIYEFTPSETGDILFTCWMGSGCHYNFIHVTEDGTYSLQKPGDAENINAVRDGDNINVSFSAPANPDNVTVRGYKVSAVADDGSKVNASGTESPIVLKNADKSKKYTISVITLSNAGKSAGTETITLDVEAAGAEAGVPDALDGQKAAAAPEVTATSAETTTAAVTESPAETTSETAPAKVTTAAEETTVATTTEAAEQTTSAQTTTSKPVTSAQVTTSKPGNVTSTPKTGSSAPTAAVIFMITSLGAAFITKKNHR
ncbi:MAG: hypothetical protein IJL67_08935 [Oscillospiraceae bacterium]|nr:hypothetical protein [Oscillospiraceae bacterium]